MITVACGSGLTAILTATLFLSGCSATDAPGTRPSSTTAFEHIHKIEAGHLDGVLLIAAHDGLYRLAIGQDGDALVAGPIGDFDFDLMGFATAGKTTFASGHPGPKTAGTFGTPNLGLITSTDLGKTWINVSLTGVTDFHALTASAGEGTDTRVFGIDTGKQRILRSMDGGTTWSEGAEINARDILAVGRQLYATTPDGLAVSEDNGTSFVVDSTAPDLYLVAADQAGTLAGVDVHGNVWTRDAGGLWTTRGAVTSTPQALAVNGKRIYVADDRGIAFSDDKGETWTILTLRV
ncbi:MAG: sialidase family protein [Terrimesophilobacter sp.]